MAQWLVIGIMAMVLVAQGIYTLLLRRRLRAVEQRQQSQADKMRQELAALNSAAVGVGQRLINAEKTLRDAVAGHASSVRTNDADEPLDRAVHSAQQGMSAAELVDRFGLSEAEANLLSLLKMQSSATAEQCAGHDNPASVA